MSFELAVAAIGVAVTLPSAILAMLLLKDRLWKPKR